MTYTLTGMSGLGTIKSEEQSMTCSLLQFPMPASPSNEAFLQDIFGALRTIVITGTYTTADGTIATFISELDGLQNGLQTAKTFHSDKANDDYTVLVNRTRWNVGEGEVAQVNYEIEMIEGSLT